MLAASLKYYVYIIVRDLFSLVTSSYTINTAADNPDIRTCDLSNGTWVRYYGGTIYTNTTCELLPDNLNCVKYGKDRDFVKWRWQPHGCHLPRFDPKQFLNAMRGMTLAFFGDSNSRYQKDSLLCLLSQVIKMDNLVYLIILIN